MYAFFPSVFKVSRLLLLLPLLTACAGTQVDRSSTALFAEKNYRTYDWAAAPLESLPGDTLPLADVNNILRDELNAVLDELGYREVDADGEFSVRFQLRRSFTNSPLSLDRDPPYGMPQSVHNRTPDQALLDNAQALSGPKAVNNILIQFDDGNTGSLLWTAGISRVVENANNNELDMDQLRQELRQALRRATLNLPRAPG